MAAPAPQRYLQHINSTLVKIPKCTEWQSTRKCVKKTILQFFLSREINSIFFSSQLTVNTNGIFTA